MLNSKQRAFLRGKANKIETILQIGKGGITDSVIAQVNDALTARELIKIRVLESCDYVAKEAAQILSEATDSDVVQFIGTRFVLFRRNNENPIYEFEK